MTAPTVASILRALVDTARAWEDRKIDADDALAMASLAAADARSIMPDHQAETRPTDDRLAILAAVLRDLGYDARAEGRHCSIDIGPDSLGPSQGVRIGIMPADKDRASIMLYDAKALIVDGWGIEPMPPHDDEE